MAVPVLHVALGMSVPFTVGMAAYIEKKRMTSLMLALIFIFMLFCGAFAVIPDVPRYFPGEYHHLGKKVNDSAFSNFFFLHVLLDKNEPEDEGLVEGAAIIFAMLFIILAVSGKSAIANEKEIMSLEKEVFPD